MLSDILFQVCFRVPKAKTNLFIHFMALSIVSGSNKINSLYRTQHEQVQGSGNSIARSNALHKVSYNLTKGEV
jgi:hypothetical protein